jgi:glycosyltransferase involved in cell wall biosynthesis
MLWSGHCNAPEPVADDQERTMSSRIADLADVEKSHQAEPVDYGPRPVRVDLHCHSDASNEADEAVLNAIGCPESFSRPAEVHAQARRRGMDLVTITDHDSLAGVATLADRGDVIVGEELTCYVPEDRCKIHLLVWGHTPADHAALQAAAADIYAVADIVERGNLAHAVAHALYRQNDRLERFHLERLILLFKGFELLNGAHSVLHRQHLEPVLDDLTPTSIEELSIRHGLPARWPEPHVKARTGGSDDHGLFNIGRTWTEFPSDATTPAAVLECLRTGRCRPGGEAGSSLKLAHNFYGVGLRFHGRKVNGSSSVRPVVQALTGEGRRVRRRDVIRAVVSHKARGIGRRLTRPFRRPSAPTGTALLTDLLMRSSVARLPAHPAVADAVRGGRAALAEHGPLFSLLSAVNRDVAAGVAEAVAASLGRGEIGGLFDALSTVAAHQALLIPYYFALSVQNRERAVLGRVTGRGDGVTPGTLRLGVFTDTFDEVNGIGRYVRDMATQARAAGRSMRIATCAVKPTVDCPSRVNFAPLVTCPTPFYPDLPQSIPPLLEVMEWADRQQFDAIHIHTPGPMGLCGLAVAAMLRVPVVMTYHTDLPRYVSDLTGGDHRLTAAMSAYLRWLHGRADVTLARTKAYRGQLRDLGIPDDRLSTTPPGVDTEKFNPRHRDVNVWAARNVGQPHRLLYAGRVSLEKNLPFLADAFRRLCRTRDDVALVIAGDGPFRKQMAGELKGLPVHFLGWQNDAQLAELYASSDLLVFPSNTDTLGQVVLEAQASGLPVLVSDQGGPREVTDDGITGRVIPTDDPAAWAAAIDELLTDTPGRLRMGRSASTRMARFGMSHAFEAFWDEHVQIVAGRSTANPGPAQPAPNAPAAHVAV